jgi:hypothetical protein
MRPGLAKMIEKVRISTYFDHAETDLHMAENAYCMHWTNTWSSKRVDWLSQSQSPDCCTTHSGCEVTLERDTGVAQAPPLNTWIQSGVASKPKVQRLPATLPNTGWVNYCHVCHGSFTAIPVLDPVSVNMLYRHSESRHHSIHWHVWSDGWRDAGFAQEEDITEGRRILCQQVCAAESVQILLCSDCNDWSASRSGTYSSSFRLVVIIYKVGQGNRH